MPKGIYKDKTKYVGGKKGRKFSEETKRKLSLSHKGKKKSLQTKLKMSIAKAGSKHYNWQGGITQNKTYLSWLKNRRNRMKKIAYGSHTFGEWELLRKQYGYICPCCGRKEPEIKLTEDHIVPLSKGGSDYIENIQPLCRSCNSKKHTEIKKYGICL